MSECRGWRRRVYILRDIWVRLSTQPRLRRQYLCESNMNIFFYWRIITLAFGLQASKKVVEAGYFVNILKFPSLCPLTSFCAPWNPVTGSKSIELINHNKINLTIDGLYILRPRGRLKNNIACWAHAENATTAWCQLYSDTGIVFCNEEDRGYDDDQMITRYMVPKNCVEWKTDSDHMTNAFYTSIVLIVGRKGWEFFS
jgi:hypothetical protein